MKAWKCYNCERKTGDSGGFDFEADKPICPKCGADGTTERGRQAVQARVILHYDPPSEIDGVGVNSLACRPDAKILGNKQKLRATGDHRVVTCPACKLTDAWKAADAGTEDLSNDVPTVEFAGFHQAGPQSATLTGVQRTTTA